ncbi:extracellular solute-binding protein [Paenibacillus piri]|uniref:Extracellular solute-binding protein n=1 Tax=Paenibacillus piri TaxID=2547395 RepID=A0A4R5KIV8_9BACL|nr:extracellular solute-binding protein [Paenibacillus piri]TDF95423.1 extracellular solute-binding protein [Paenibacillus piri]
MSMFANQMMVKSGAAVLAAAVLLAGCTQNSGPQPKKNTSETKPKIKVALYDSNKVPQEEGTLENNRWTKWINENGPVEVEFVPIPRGATEALQKYNILFASNSAPDIIMAIDAPVRNNLYSQKLLLPLDELINKSSTTYKQFLDNNPEFRKVAVKDDGKMYDIGITRSYYPNHVLMIRTDWLKKLNLSVPKTTGELLEVARAFAKQDPDGNGKADTYGMALSGASDSVLKNMFGDTQWLLTNDTITLNLERSKAFVQFKKSLFDEGIVDKDFLTDKDGKKSLQDWVNGKIGIYGDTYTAGGFNNYQVLKKNIPNAEVSIIQLPVSPFGQFSPLLHNPLFPTASVNANTKQPEAVMKYIDFMAKPETQYMLNFGIEGVHHTKSDASGCPKPVSTEKNKQELDWNRYYNLLSISSDKCLQIYKYSLDPADPIQNDYIRLGEEAEAAYITAERQVPSFTHINLMPSLPKEIGLIHTNAMTPISDLWVKAIVSGRAYTVDQAYQEAMDTWNKAGGAKVEQWYKDWYKENKSKIIPTADLLKYAPKTK